MISQAALQEFKALYRDEFNKDISDEQATELAINLLTAFNHAYRPVRKEWLKDLENEKERKVVIGVKNENENDKLGKQQVR